MNSINSIQLIFQMQNEAFARNLYGRWNSFFANCVERILNEELELRNEELLEIEKLELDLGSIWEEAFDEQFSNRFREKLEEALIQLRVESGKLRVKNAKHNENPLSTFHSPLSTLLHFLLHGTLPWNATDEHKDINRLFLNVLQESPKELENFLQTYGHYTSFRERLVYQLKDPQLEKGVYLLESGSGSFIIGYVQFLQVKYKDVERSGMTQSDYRNAVWFVVYAYLLTNRSSFFDKKSFVTQTMLQLAGKYNIRYDALLQLLTSELEQFAERQNIPWELFQILSQLQKEFSEKQYRESLVNAATFYKTIYHSLQKKTDENIPPSDREALVSILANAGSCRAFLQYLKEEEIKALVPILTLYESQFVIEMAHQLDIQKEQGELQGKAGSEFRLLKWQIIFPLLPENRGSSFNRKYFVQNVFSKVAARYNIDVLLLFTYFNQEPQIVKLDKDLKNIIRQLVEELQGKQSDKGTEQHFEVFELIRQAVKQKIKLPADRIKQTCKQLSDADFRRKIILQFNETELTGLFKLLKPDMSDAILSFLKNLNDIFKDKNLQHKTDSEFNKQKWNILLSGLESNSFDSKKSMNFILEQAEFFYDITRFELLFAFQEEKISCNLSYNAKKIIEELCRDEKEKQPQLFWHKLTELSQGNKLPVQVIKQQNSYMSNSKVENKNNQESPVIIKEELKLKKMEEIMNNQTEPIFVDNAGMVLLSPFFPRLFGLLNLVENNQFKDKDAQIKAVYVLQYAIFEKTNFPEHELTLNKIFAGLEISETIPQNVELTEKEIEIAISMVKGIQQNWQKMKTTSIDGFRQAFLQRSGKLEEKEELHSLIVEEKAFDMLLDTLPWNFRMIKFPWMKKRMEVKWR